MPRTVRGGITLAEEPVRPRRRRRRTALVLGALVVGLAGAGAYGLRGTFREFATPSCRGFAMSTEVTFSPEQTDNAATIVAVSIERGLPARAATIAIATAIQESKLRNIDYGDRDSVGLFQQRPSQGWGTVEQIMQPVYATNKFYDALVKIDGWQTMEITKIAQAVQRSAAPEAYAEHETEGRVLASTLAGHAPGDFGCRIDPPSGPGDESGLQKAMQAELGVAGRRVGNTLEVSTTNTTMAWAVGSWAVAKAQSHGVRSVVVGDRQWTASRDASGWSWQPAPTPARSARTVVLHVS